VARLSFAIIN